MKPIKNCWIGVPFAMVIGLQASPAGAAGTPVYADWVKFSQFITAAEESECDELVSAFKEKFPFNGLACKRAYAEYKIARQMSYGDHDQAFSKLNPHGKFIKTIYFRRAQLEKNDFEHGGGIYDDRSFFSYLADGIIDRGKGNTRDFYRLLGAFKRMYEEK